MLIVTVPAPIRRNAPDVARMYGVEAFRFNTGVSVPNPLSTLHMLKNMIFPEKTLWVDLKCRQLRIASWGDPSFTEVELNREIEVNLPARILFRGGHSVDIESVHGNRVFLADSPKECVGKGQSVNISTSRLQVKGPLFTNLDLEYLDACKKLGIIHIMASYVKTWEDVEEIEAAAKQLNTESEVYLKIEDKAGLANIVRTSTSLRGMHLELARDDLFTEIPKSLHSIHSATLDTIHRDPDALVASRILPSVAQGGVTHADMYDVACLYSWGYRNFMFQDSLSENTHVLRDAIEIFKECIEWAKEMDLQS
jgi:hypothetical protein